MNRWRFFLYADNFLTIIGIAMAHTKEWHVHKGKSRRYLQFSECLAFLPFQNSNIMVSPVPTSSPRMMRMFGFFLGAVHIPHDLGHAFAISDGVSVFHLS